MIKVLLAEDTADLNRALSAILTHEGYDVTAVFDGEEALTCLRTNAYDAVILDIMMPKKDGLEVLSSMRAEGNNSPVLLLTAKAEVDDRVNGLDAGADDYLTKPFAMKELLARIRSMTRRRSSYSGGELRIGDLTLNAENFELRAENSVRLSIKEFELTPREFELLASLMKNAGKPLKTSFLLQHVWANDTGTGEETVWLYISYLRNKLNAVASHVSLEGTRGESFSLVNHQ